MEATYYNSVDIDDSLKCFYCKQKFNDAIKLLPDCGESICGDCYEDLKDSLFEEDRARVDFKCACGKRHKLPREGLPDNKVVLNILRKKKKEKPLSERARVLKSSIKSIRDQLDDLKSYDAREHVAHNCEQLEYEVKDEIESVKKKLEEIEHELRKQIIDYREKCMQTLTAQAASAGPLGEKSKQELDGLSDAIHAFNGKWELFFGSLDALASDAEIEAALIESSHYERRINVLRKKSFPGKQMVFKTDHSFFKADSCLKKSFTLVFQEIISEDVELKPSTLHRLVGHSEPVNHAVFLPNGKLASCSSDNSIRIWDLKDGKEVCALNGHTNHVFSLALLDHNLLASGSKDRTIRIWDFEQQKEVRILTGHIRPVESVCRLKDGNLASCAADETIRIWDPYSDEKNLLATISGLGSANIIRSDVLSDGNLVACSRDQDDKSECILRIWNPNDGRMIKTVSTGLTMVDSMLALPDQQVALGCSNGTIKVINLADDALTRIKEKAHKHIISSLGRLPNGNLLSAGNDSDSSIKIFIKQWILPDISPLQTIATDYSSYNFLICISSEQKTVATTGPDNTIQLWSIVNK